MLNPKKGIYSIFLLLISVIQLQAQSPNYPFPNHEIYTIGTIQPNNYTQTQLDNAVADFYDMWKSVYLKEGCDSGQYFVEFLEGNNICVSEGIGYGMLITAIMAGYDTSAKTYFDGLYMWYKTHPSPFNLRLMDWLQDKGCNSIGGSSATDGDLDIAYGLLLADDQWGSSGDINYILEAVNMINAIRLSEIYPWVNSVQLGDWAKNDQKYKDDTRTSDFMFDHFRSFLNATKDSVWDKVIHECYYLVD